MIGGNRWRRRRYWGNVRAICGVALIIILFALITLWMNGYWGEVKWLR